ncbi:MAG: FAD-binding oxidoreductase [Thermomonas sp.]|uniref:NAD(P)/FAD-dependent oxidoreductase n=1 Tax=Thermomonas sp. TaxID=1971895 RepID=UPI0039E36DC8
MTSPSASALVIGGGVVGRACALALQRDGWQVTLADADANRSAPSWGNAGHIATEQMEPLASLATLRSAPRRWHGFGGALDVREPLRRLPWVMRYLRACTPSRFEAGKRAMRGLLADALPAWQRLVQTISAPELLQQHGHWVCWESEASTKRGLAAWQGTDIGSARFSSLGDAQRAALQAALSIPIAGGIAFDGTAQIADLPTLAQRLAEAFAKAGGVQRTIRVRSLQRENRRVHAMTSDGERIDADLLLVCAGVRSRALVEPLGLRAPLVAERGYHLQWATHDWPALPPVVFEDRSMILTRFTGGLRAASFVEYAGIDTPPDTRKWARLREHVVQLGIPVHGEPVPWFGARPTLPDYLPALGRSERFDNLAYAFGHQHLGLTLAAISGELLADLCAGRVKAQASFDLERFG